jgi:uncharacterized protein HemX
MDESHLLAAIGALTGAVVILWRLDRARLLQENDRMRQERDDARAETAECREQISEGTRARLKDAENFLRALAKKRDGSSSQPPISSSTPGTRTPR